MLLALLKADPDAPLLQLEENGLITLRVMVAGAQLWLVIAGAVLALFA